MSYRFFFKLNLFIVILPNRISGNYTRPYHETLFYYCRLFLKKSFVLTNWAGSQILAISTHSFCKHNAIGVGKLVWGKGIASTCEPQNY